MAPSSSRSSPRKTQNSEAALDGFMKTKQKPGPQPYRANLTIHFMVVVLVSSSWISYLIGTAAKTHLSNVYALSMQGLSVYQQGCSLAQNLDLHNTTGDGSNTCQAFLYDGDWIRYDIDHEEDHEEDDEDDDVDDEISLSPTGKHLILDLQGIDGAFLQSEDMLKQAMVDLVKLVGSFDLQYTYSQKTPMGNVLVGGVAEDQHHVWLQSFPRNSAILLDLFTADESENMRATVTKIETYFLDHIQRSNPAASSSMMWAVKSRGFHDMLDEADAHALGDLQWFPIGTMIDYKKEVASVQTPFQHISIWDVTDSGNEQNIVDRIVYLDGLLQSRRTGDAPYHESLVHPAMFAHANPKRVAIIGGGEGATLREVLKHNTVEEVVMIDIDEMMVNTSRTFLPEWSDCSNIQGSTENCFDDPRTSLYCEDAFRWFKSRFGPEATVVESSPDLFDVIIMDALDPQGVQEIVEALYTDAIFYRSLHDGLSADGILIAQVGEATELDDPYDSFVDRNLWSFVNGLKRLGFRKITEYEEGDCGFYAPWGFVMASKHPGPLTESLFTNEALVSLKIRQRMIPTVDGSSPLRYFDGATMNKYKYPSKAMVVHHCRNPAKLETCLVGQGFQEDTINRLLTETISGIPDAGNKNTCYQPGVSSSHLGLESLISSIVMDSSTGTVISTVENLCGVGVCRNTALRSMSDAYGIEGTTGVFIPAHPALSCISGLNKSEGFIDSETADLVRHRQANSILSTVYSFS
ncbi:spermidine synthase [Nitzschia inconspicua]|uniref:Spermidine synthase n=1 Tax=Nitzschia inconspicua TaxID=303405 RepID=A0A9K3PSB8_9STRA|nr:spermidine synthase [Nitzschia inconspicua]